MSESVTTPSGATLEITVAPFDDADALRKALLRSFKGIPLSANILEQDVTDFKDAFISAWTSDEVEKCLFKCFERVAYEGIRLTRSLFDDPELGTRLRKDYLTVCQEVIRVNCSPFFDQILSTLREKLRTKLVIPKPGSTSTMP